jgi:hypothetical protein
MRTLFIRILSFLLTACGGDSVPFEQLKVAMDEPENHSLEDMNAILAPNGGVLGDIESGKSDFYFVDVDFFDNGIHQFSLSEITTNLDMRVIDWNDIEYVSQASGTSDELINGISTEQEGFFSDKRRIIIEIYSADGISESKFTLTMQTTSS